MKSKRYTLGCDERGFLASCNGHEKECVKECYNILNKYMNQLYGVESNGFNSLPNIGTDTAIPLEKEIANLKAKFGTWPSNKLFQVVESGAKNFLFIKTTIEDPVKLATAIVKDISENRQLQARHLIRLIPIEITCKAYIDNIKRACERLLDAHFKSCTKSFSIAYHHRNSTNNLTRDIVISEIAKLVNSCGKGHTVDLDNADITIVVEVIRSIALLAAIPAYLEYKKFNLHAICKNESCSVTTNRTCKNIDDAL